MKIELKKSNKIVIKVGSSIINNNDGKDYLSNICNEISLLMKKGKEIIIVTSGAISQGMAILDMNDRPRDIKKLQALAAIGQQKLMLDYEKIFSQNNNKIAQLLITHNDINDRVRYLNIKGTIEELISHGIIPIINENDLIKILKDEKIAGVGLDVYDKEPLPQDHKLRFLPNALILPHIGYVTAENYSKFYLQMIENLESCSSNKPIRLMLN